MSRQDRRTEQESSDALAQSDRDALAAAMETYLSLSEKNALPDREEFLRRYPHLPELQDCLEAFDFVEHVAPQVNGPDGDATVFHSPIQLGDYRILEELGRGGMGVVYKAEQLSLGRHVALKVLPFGALIDQRRLTRFRHEAQAAALLKHPRIVSVHTVGCERGVHFYAMEWVDGPSLTDVISYLHSGSDELPRHDMSSAESETGPVAHLSTQLSSAKHEFYRSVARLGAEAADAIQSAHDEGIVHRDIKPSNLLLDRDGRVSVTDFGLATIPGGSELTVSGDILGTLRYMSPEQASGQRGVVGHQTDIYSLGATLYELATGQPALLGENRQELLQNLDTSAPLAPRRLAPAMPKDLETIILKALSRDPLARYATAQQFADDLSCFIDLKPIKARRPRATDVLGRWARRNPMTSGLIALSIGLLLTLTFVSIYFAVEKSLLAEQRRQELYDRHIQAAAAMVGRGEFASARELLEPYSGRNGDRDLRNFEWFHLWNQCVRHQNTPSAENWISLGRLVCSPTSPTFAVSEDETGVFYVYDANTMQRTWHGKHASVVTGLAYFKDGSVLITAGGKTVKFWEADTGVEVLPSLRFEESVFSVALSKDGLLAIGHRTGNVTFPGSAPVSISLYRMAIEDGQIEVTTNQPPKLEGCVGSVLTLAVSADGKQLVAGCHDRTVRMWDLSDGYRLRQLEGHLGPTTSLAFSPNGRQLCAGGGRYRSGWLVSELTIWDLEKLTAERRTGPGHGNIRGIVFSKHDPMAFSAGANSGEIQVWNTDTWERSDTLRVHASKVNAISLAHDGGALVSAGADSKVYLSTLHMPKPRNDLRHESRGALIDIDFARDSGTLYSGCGDGTVRQWNVGQGSLVREFPPHRFSVFGVSVSPDQRKLATVATKWFGSRESEPGELQIWDVATGKLDHRLQCDSSYVRSVDFAPNGYQLAYVTADNLVLWDVRSRDVIERIPLREKEQGYCVVFSRQGDKLACATTEARGRIRVWDFPDMQSCQTFEGGAFALAISPDSRWIASNGHSSGSIHLRDIESGEEVRPLRGHTSLVIAADFSPDGQRLVTGATDGSVIVWNLQTGNELLTFRSRSGWVQRVRFSPDGKVVAASYRGLDEPPQVRLWRQ